MKITLALFTLLAISLTACGGDSEEPCISLDYYMAIEPKLEEWDDAVEVAGSTSRIALAPQITRLQDIKREVEDMDIPWCGVFAHMELIKAMEYRIDAFLAFMSQEDDEEVTRLSDLANSAIDDWSEAVDDIDN